MTEATVRRAATSTGTRISQYEELHATDRPLTLGTGGRAPSTRVLVVDDERAICRALSLALRLSHFEVMTAESGDAAVAIVASQSIDVMVIDLRIPDMRGDVVFELAAASQPHLRDTTLFMTADFSERAHRLILSCQCPLIRKPFALTDFMREVREVALKRRAVVETGVP